MWIRVKPFLTDQSSENIDVIRVKQIKIHTKTITSRTQISILGTVASHSHCALLVMSVRER